MCFHVFLTVDRGFECFLTVGAHEWPHLAVRGHVTLEAAIGSEGTVADQTLVRLHARVGANMGLQDTVRHKCLQAGEAFVWLLS